MRFTNTENYFVSEASVYRLPKAHELIASPRLLPDPGSSYIAADLAKWLGGQNMEHVRGAPYHPMTQGKIERRHQTLKNRILLENHLLGDLEVQIEAFVADYNHLHLRYHESIANLTPADVSCGRGQAILIEEKGSNDRHPPIDACCTVGKLHNITNQTSQKRHRNLSQKL